MIPGRRFTVVRQSDGHFLIEDAHSAEQARVDGLDGIGEQIGRWLTPLDPEPAATTPPSPRSPEA